MTTILGKDWQELDHFLIPKIEDRNILNSFLYSDDEDLVSWAVMNPLVGADELKEFVNRTPDIRHGVASNHNLNAEVCEAMIEHMTEEDDLSEILGLLEMQMGGRLPENLFFKWLLKFGDSAFSTTEFYFDTLIHSTDVESMLALVTVGIQDVDLIAMNPIWTEEQLDEWAKSDNFFLRKGVAANEKTSRETLEMLAGDPNDEVRGAVARNKQTPKKTLEMLAKDSDEYVREAATETLEEM